MKITVLDPLAILGSRYGYTRPLDRHDFDGSRATNALGNGGHVPHWAHDAFPNVGELKRFTNLNNHMGIGGISEDGFTWSTTQQHALGTMGVSKDGRTFRYVQAGAADLVAGNLEQSAAPIPNHLGRTAAAQNVGDGGQQTPIVFTPGATVGDANLYSQGTLVISTTPSLGLQYRVAGHAAIASATAFNLYLDPDDRLQIALTTSSKYGLHHNPWKNIIQTPTTITAKVIGSAVAAIPTTQYGWVQSRGSAAVLINGTPAVTAPVINSATTAGAADVWTAAAQPTANLVGHMMQVGVSGECNSVFLCID